MPVNSRPALEARIRAADQPPPVAGKRRLVEHRVAYRVAQADGPLGTGDQVADDRVEGDPVTPVGEVADPASTVRSPSGVISISWVEPLSSLPARIRPSRSVSNAL